VRRLAGVSPRRYAALAVALAAAGLLAGCAVMRVAYDNADTFLRWRAGNYVELEGGQAQELEERIDAFHAWHRAHALPKYEALAREAARRVTAGLSPEDLVWGYDSLTAQAKEGLREGAMRIAPLLDGLDASQHERIEKGFAEDNRRFARDYLRGSEEERRKRRVKRVVGRLEDWVGTLSEPQVERVRRFAEQVSGVDELRAADRRRLQDEFLDIVRRREAQRRLPELAANWERGRDPAYAQAARRFRSEYGALLLDFERSLSPEQRGRAAARLRAHAEDFRALSAAARR